MPTPKKKTPQELAQEDWDYIGAILDKQREMERKLYLKAFEHGYKHGKKG